MIKTAGISSTSLFLLIKDLSTSSVFYENSQTKNIIDYGVPMFLNTMGIFNVGFYSARHQNEKKQPKTNRSRIVIAERAIDKF